ncbi:helix-turn-helix domain-containing protein [Scytonema sp. UIC 10036]|uniref:helix-turn-helix domain-containing protein n=1 Tax=Scytonema sp. UIC 10036 TaxID=2304196 RepID=UPI0012DAC112|nr:helix-turn-helix domain-containing protein [Scytonema sp. UIC 10036]MUH00090.1 helix-turn-helix domain-containing protein [Scytonema sp. UIC 10036]
MKSNKNAKALALKLYQENKLTDEVARRCGVSRRTVQRWFSEFEQTGIVIIGKNETSQEETTNNVAAVSPTISVLEKVANIEPNQTLDLSLSSRLAIRLLNLTESAIATVEECLTNVDVKPTDRLKAAEMVARWVGLDDKERRSVFYQVALSCDADLQIVDLEKSSATVKPQKVVLAQQKLEEEREREQKAAKQKIIDYNDNVCEYFADYKRLPNELTDDFDLEHFLNFFQCDEDFIEDYQTYQKALAALRARGYDC